MNQRSEWIPEGEHFSASPLTHRCYLQHSQWRYWISIWNRKSSTLFTQFSQFVWIDCVLCCKLKYCLLCLVRLVFWFICSFYWYTINIFMDFEALERTTKNFKLILITLNPIYSWNILCENLQLHTHQYSLHRGHLYFFVCSEHSKHFIVGLKSK